MITSQKTNEITTTAYNYTSQIGDMVVLGRATPTDNKGTTLTESLTVQNNQKAIDRFFSAVKMMNDRQDFWRDLAPTGMWEVLRQEFDMTLPAHMRAGYVADPDKDAPTDVYGNFIGAGAEKYKRRGLCTDLIQCACQDFVRFGSQTTLGGIITFDEDKDALNSRREFYRNLDFDLTKVGTQESVSTIISQNPKLHTIGKFRHNPALAAQFADLLNE